MSNKATILFNGNNANFLEKVAIKSSSIDNTYIEINEGIQYNLTQDEMDQLPVGSYTILVPLPTPTSSVALPIGASTETTLASVLAKLPTSGQVTMANSKPVVIASDQSILPMQLTGYTAPLVVTPAAQSSVADIYNADVSMYRTISVQLTNVGTNTISWQGSNDNVTWYAINGQRVSAGSLNTSASTPDLYIIPVLYKYFKLRCTSWTSGTASAVIVFFSDPQGTNSVLATPSTNFPVIGAGAVGTVVTASAPVRIGGSDGTNVRNILTDIAGSFTIGNSSKATYLVNIINAAPISANYIIATIESGTTKILRLRRIIISNIGNATAAQKTVISILRTTAAATGGATTTPASLDVSDAVYSGIVRITNPTITAGTVLYQTSAYTPTALAAFTPMVIDFTRQNMKAIIVTAGITNGLALRIDNGAAGYTNLDIILEFTEE